MRMLKLSGKWWPFWLLLTVLWTLVIAASAWTHLPRARQMPHDPGLLSQLSNEAAAVLRTRETVASAARGAPVWFDVPRTVRMSNGTRLTFSAITTNEQAAVVEGEYLQLLTERADELRAPFLLKMLALWLAPLMIAALLTRVPRHARRQMNNESGLRTPAHREVAQCQQQLHA